MFSGEHEHTVDDKGRVTIPVEYRGALADGLYVTRGLDGCLFVFPKADWEVLAQKVAEKLLLTDVDARNFSRMMFSGVEDKLDKQGRILLPPSLREHASLDSDVIILGVHSRLEIWNKERWRETTRHMKEGNIFAQELSKLGI